MDFNVEVYESLLESLNIKDNSENCWEWQGSRDKRGYGIITKRMGRSAGITARANRISYALFVEMPPPHLLVCHSCDNPPCCNPYHLWLGTSKDNTTDAIKKLRFDGVNRGEKNGSAKLTEDDVLEIRLRFFSGRETIKYLAEEYGISRASVENVVHGRKWPHLPLTEEQKSLIPELLPRMFGRKSDKERFLRYVKMTNNPDDHWIWIGYINDKGLPKFNHLKDGKPSGSIALRAAYRIFIGEIPNGYKVCHVCDILVCVNPRHSTLELK